MLKDFELLHPATKTNLLLGNGFSIGINNKFSYNSLLDVAKSHGFITGIESQLFEKFNTVNFEHILNQLSNAASVNKILDINYEVPQEKYTLIRDALIKCVNYVHPKFSELDDAWIINVLSELLKYKEIYTTNYDLILYWIMSQNDFRKFTDYFWSEKLTFDQFNTELWGSSIPVHYLHGALFIFTDDFKVKKVKKSELLSLLDSIENQLRKNEIPLFISEGTSQQKMKAIYKESYLTFVFEKYINLSEGMTFYGFSFSESDKHITSAINESSKLKHLAISIYSKDKSEREINSEIDQIKIKLAPFLDRKDNSLEFFDYCTSPFYYREQLDL